MSMVDVVLENEKDFEDYHPDAILSQNSSSAKNLTGKEQLLQHQQWMTIPLQHHNDTPGTK